MAAPTPDVMAIASLLKSERSYRDAAQWDLCRATFHPVRTVLAYEGNVEDFLRQSAQMHKGKVNIIHSSFDPVEIHGRGDRGVSEAFCLVTSSITLDGVNYELASRMALFTRLQKLSDPNEWQLLSLESSYVRDRLITAIPTVHADVQLAKTHEAQPYPKSYRCLALVMLNRGLKPRPDLPHEDDSERERRTLDQNCAYLHISEA